MQISFSEILLILLVALLVIKPAHLPGAVYTVGKWIKWLRQMTAKIKHEVVREIESHERK